MVTPIPSLEEDASRKKATTRKSLSARILVERRMASDTYVRLTHAISRRQFELLLEEKSPLEMAMPRYVKTKLSENSLIDRDWKRDHYRSGYLFKEVRKEVITKKNAQYFCEQEVAAADVIEAQRLFWEVEIKKLEADFHACPRKQEDRRLELFAQLVIARAALTQCSLYILENSSCSTARLSRTLESLLLHSLHRAQENSVDFSMVCLPCYKKVLHADGLVV